jgi:DNA-binding transcriptional ArsR family regulator
MGSSSYSIIIELGMTEFVHEAMPRTQPLAVRVLAGAGLETLMGVSALTRDESSLEGCSPDLRAAIHGVGTGSSELWLHLLGLALAHPDDVVAAVRETRPAELRRHLAGVFVPAWRQLVGAHALEATARGATALLDHDRYYAGRARASLELLLPLSPAETKRRVLAVLERYSEEQLDPSDVAELKREATAKNTLGVEAAQLIALACPGYRYEPEPELPDVALVPHKASRPWLLLCQHERTRIICYPLPQRRGTQERIVALGRALGDEKRVRMLMRLVEDDASLAELAETAKVAKSTAHHHLGQLRNAGLVEMHGNAQGYWFSLRRDGITDARNLLLELQL